MASAGGQYRARYASRGLSSGLGRLSRCAQVREKSLGIPANEGRGHLTATGVGQILFPGTGQVIGKMPGHPQHSISDVDKMPPAFFSSSDGCLTGREQELLFPKTEEVLQVAA